MNRWKILGYGYVASTTLASIVRGFQQAKEPENWNLKRRHQIFNRGLAEGVSMACVAPLVGATIIIAAPLLIVHTKVTYDGISDT